MDSMRWILLAIGALVVLAVYFWSRRRAAAEEDFVRHEPAMQGGGHAEDDALDPLFAPLPKTRAGAIDGRDAVAPALQSAADEPDLQAVQQELSSLQQLLNEEAQEDSSANARARLVREIPSVSPATASAPTRVPAEEKILALYVVSGSDEPFSGEAVQAAMNAVGLRYGDMQIYHRRLDGKEQGPAVFSVANLVEPGTLEPERLAETGTPGLSMFLQLPGPVPPLSAFEMFVRCAQQLAQELGGELRDRTRSSFTRQMYDHLRDEIQQYERRQQLHRRA